MILPMKSKEIHQRFGDHKTLMNVQYIDERELVVWISTPLLVLRAGWYDFATRVAKPRVKAKSYHPNRKAILGQQEWLKSIQPRARINVLHSLIVLVTTSILTNYSKINAINSIKSNHMDAH